MSKPFETAVQHLKDISGPFDLDLGILRDGFVDLQARLHALEAQAETAKTFFASRTPIGGVKSS